MLNLFQYLIFPLSLSLSAVDVHIYFVFSRSPASSGGCRTGEKGDDH